jgi:hypothetical protein
MFKAIGSRTVDRLRPGLYQAVSRVGDAMDAEPFNPSDMRAAARALRTVVQAIGWSDGEIASLATGICVTAKRMHLAAAQRTGQLGIEGAAAMMADELGVQFDVEHPWDRGQP